MKINMQTWAEDIIAAKEVENLPILFFPYLNISGKTITEVVNDSHLQYESMEGVIERFPKMIAAMTSMDLTVEAETFGCEIRFSDTEAPAAISGAVSDRASIDALKVPSVGSGRGPLFVEAARLAAKGITDRPTFGGMLGPFSLAAVLMELVPTLKALKKDPETIHVLLDKCTEFSIAYARAYKEAGANGILYAEPTAGLLSAQQCEEFSSHYVKRFVDAVQDEYFFIILHNCGQTTKQVDSMVGTGAKGYHFGNAVQMTDIITQIPQDYLVLGNIDPSSILSQGTPELVRSETLDLLNRMRPYPHFILSSGCDLPMGVPTPNLDAYFDALEEFNAQN